MASKLETTCEATSSYEESKPDIACKNIYPALARALLYDLHANCMELLRKYLPATPAPRTLVVVGPGPDILPFSEHRDDIAGMLNDGNLVLMDYNKAICDKISAYLLEKDFDKKFSIKEIDSHYGNYDPTKFKNTVFVQVRNILHGYNFPDSTVSAIDMTVAVHHATQYESDILNICKEAYRVLIPGGILHIGEGNVDMKYSERKLKKISQDLLDSGEESITVLDARYQDLPSRALYFGKNQLESAEVWISDKAMVRILHTKDISKTFNYFRDIGYKQICLLGDSIIFPFIDHAMEEDFQGMIVPVRNYYSAVKQTCLEKLAKDKHEAFLKAITKEQSDAERGVVEFYSPPAMLIDNLKKAGFSIAETRYTEHGPFINILAKKE